MMLVEVPDAAAVVWTRPDDFPANADQPLKHLLGLRRGGFLTAFADGAPHFIYDGIPPEMLRRLLVRNDHQSVDNRDFRRDTLHPNGS